VPDVAGPPYRGGVHRHRNLRAAATTALLLCLAVAAGCGDGAPTVPIGGGPPQVDVAAGDGSASLRTGETLRVDLGPVNSSIGDGWFLVEAPDPAVLTDRGRDAEQECDEPGCGARLRWAFAAAGPGTTPLVFRYCFRSQPPACEPAPDGRGSAEPVTLTVTVRG
jgi:hypothetical protein